MSDIPVRSLDSSDEEHLQDHLKLNPKYNAFKNSVPEDFEVAGAAETAQAAAVQRDNHTGVQPISTVTGLQSTLDEKILRPEDDTEDVGKVLVNDPTAPGTVTWAETGFIALSAEDGELLTTEDGELLIAEDDITIPDVVGLLEALTEKATPAQISVAIAALSGAYLAPGTPYVQSVWANPWDGSPTTRCDFPVPTDAASVGFAFGISGEEYPRWLLIVDDALYMGDGTFDPYDGTNDEIHGIGYSNGSVLVQGAGGLTTQHLKAGRVTSYADVTMDTAGYPGVFGFVSQAPGGNKWRLKVANDGAPSMQLVGDGDDDSSYWGPAISMPEGTPEVGKVPIVTDDSPFKLGWGDVESGIQTIDDKVPDEAGDVYLAGTYAKTRSPGVEMVAAEGPATPATLLGPVDGTPITHTWVMGDFAYNYSWFGES